MANITSINGNPIITQVEDGSVTTAKIADGAVTDAKLDQTGVVGRVASLEDFAGGTVVNFESLRVVSGTVNSAGKKAVNAIMTSYEFENTGYSSITIWSNTDIETILSFLDQSLSNYSSGDELNFADGAGRHVIRVGTQQTFDVPPECTVVITKGTTSGDATPDNAIVKTGAGYSLASIKADVEYVNSIDSFTKRISEIIFSVDEFDYSEFTASRVTILNGKWYSSQTTRCVVVTLEDVLAVNYSVDESSPASGAIAFLKSASMRIGEDVEFSDEYTGVIAVNVGDSVTLTAPADAKYLYIRHMLANNYVVAASSLVKYTPPSSVDPSLSEKLEEIRSEIFNVSPSTSDQSGRDIPENRGVRNAYRKAHQLLDVMWTAINDVPARNGAVIGAGGLYKGVPYSSVKELHKFVGLAVSLKTFMTAVHNPYSVLYTENVSAAYGQSAYGFEYHGTNCGTYYGIVCSSLVEYALGFDIYWDTYSYDYLNRIGVFEKPYDQSAYGLKLMDVYWKNGHTRIITDIYRDERGTPTRILMSEAMGTFPSTTEYTPESFNAKMASEDAIIYRYTGLYKNLDYEPSEFVAVDGEDAPTYTYNDDICTYAGDFAAFRMGEPIYLNYTLGDYNALEIYIGESLAETLPMSDASSHSVNITEYCQTQGTYKARLTDGTNYSEWTNFAVCAAPLTCSKDGTTLTIGFSQSDATPVYAQMCNQAGDSKGYYVFSQDEVDAGTATFDALKVCNEQYGTTSFSGTTYIRVMFKTPYGVIASQMVDTTL